MNNFKSSYREAAFGESIKSGFCKYNLSDVDWLFSIGLPKIKTAVILGSKVRAGALYLSQHCEELFVIVENSDDLIRLKGIAEEEGLKNISFGIIGQNENLSLRGKVDYVAIFEGLEDSNKRLEIFSFASSLISDKGFISFFLRNKASELNEKKELNKFGFGYIESFWVIPSVWRPTWSGRFDEKESFKIWLDIIDFHNTPTFIFLWVRKIILSYPSKVLLKFILFFLFPLRKYLIKERYIFAGRRKDCFNGELTSVLEKPFVRKSKASKEGRVVFFIWDKNTNKKIVIYLSKLKQFEPFLQNELVRNTYSIYPVKSSVLDNGTKLLTSEFILGKRLDHIEADKKTIYWLIGFQERTILGHWKEEEWRSFIRDRTDVSAERIADYFLELMRREGRAIAIVAEHGDFGYLNILKVKDSQCVLDWEFYNQRGDEFFDLGYFLLNIYTEKNIKKDMSLRDFLNSAPAKCYVTSFMKAKKINNIDLIICAIVIAAIRAKYQSIYYTSTKDARYWMFDGLIKRMQSEVF